MTGPGVRRERAGDVLVLTIDNPPVNASSAAVRQHLLDGLDELAGDPGLRGGVLIGAGGTFVAGSDVAEFAGTVPDPLLPAVLRAVEDCPKPVVAALDGFALGGGLELALACDQRIATRRAVIGLPEVTLGMVPGAGGTQRLPRLAGRAWALEIILTGRRCAADEALNAGVLDDLVDASALREEAIDRARVATKRRVTELEPPDEPEDGFDELATRLLKAARRRPQAVEAERLVRLAGRVPVDDALRDERSVFDRLRLGEESRALRHLAFAERAAGRSVLPSDERPAPITTAGVVGGGSMGAGIAAVLAASGIDVVLTDRDGDAVAAAVGRTQDVLAQLVRRGHLTEPDADVAAARITTSTDVSALANAELVIEAVFEDAAVKADVLSRLEEVTGPKAVLATNTSYLDIDGLAHVLRDPERLIGLHFFNPPHLMRLVEVVRAPRSSPAAVESGLDVVRRMGKQPVLAGAASGFIGNRIFAAYRRHAEYLLEDGALPWEVDTAATSFGFPMGPFAVADLSGLQIAWAMRKEQRRQGRSPARYVDIPDLLCEAGRLGRRTGAGYYAYPSGGGAPQTDPWVEQLVLAESERKNIQRRPLDGEAIVQRLVFAMVVEAVAALDEGVADKPGDVDVAIVNGFGFPRHRGGPLWWASRQGDDLVREGVDAVARAASTPVDVDAVSSVLARVRASG